MPEVPAQNKDKVAEVVNLLGGDTGEAPGTDAEPVPGPGDGSPTDAGSALLPPESGDDPGTDDLTPTSLAETLGVKPSELFKRLRIPIDGSEDLTLEEFKSAGKDLREVKKGRNELAEQKAKFENDVMVQQQTLQAALAELPPGQLTPELIQAGQAKRGAMIENERRQLLSIRPDLRDSGKWSTTRDLLVQHLRPYGFTAVEVDAIVDHRAAKYVIDNAEREQRIKELELEPVKRPVAGSSPKPAGQSKRRQSDNAVERGKRAQTAQEKTAAVAALIGET